MPAMTYKVSHTTRYRYTELVPVCHNQVHLAPRDTPTQRCEWHKLTIQPLPAERGKRLDYFGNQVDYFELLDAHRGLTVTASSRVCVRTSNRRGAENRSWEEVAAGVLEDRTPTGLEAYQFLFPSPHVSGISCLRDYARQSFPPGRAVLEAVRDLTHRIHTDFRYDPAATNVHTTLEEVFRRRRGVCQDFAHMQIGCLRVLGLPARYVSGYLRTRPPAGQPRLIGADASHAWASVYAGQGLWVDCDPTNDVLPALDHITVSWGRDYGDVCPIQGVFVGGGRHSMSVGVDVQQIDG